MDLLQEIREKAATLTGHDALDGIKAVIRHVEVAERYFSRARNEHEEDLFNDVIYRTNQAFEGMLKEAYTVITSNDSTKLSPNQIEQYLLKEEVFSARVLELFKNYRQQWRNPSTHDHKLFFNEQESLLAIVSVSAFANILLDQIIEAINFKREQEHVQHMKAQIRQTVQDSKSKPLHEQLIALLMLFSSELIGSTPDPTVLTEVEILGRLHGFLESADLGIITREPLMVSGKIEFNTQTRRTYSIRPDFLIRRDKESVVIEVKRAGYNKSTLDRGHLQVLKYLEIAKLQHGVLYMPPAADESLNVIKVKHRTGDTVMWVHHVIPNADSSTK